MQLRERYEFFYNAGNNPPFQDSLIADYNAEKETSALGSLATLTDQRGTYNGIAVGEPQLVSDSSGKRAYEFDGIDDGYTLETLGDDIATNNDYCIAVAVRPLVASPFGNQWLFGGSGGSVSDNLHLGYKDQDNLGLHHWNDDIADTFAYSQNRLDRLIFNQTVAGGRSIYGNSTTPVATGTYDELTTNNGWAMARRSNGGAFANVRILRALIYRGLDSDSLITLYNWLDANYAE